MAQLHLQCQNIGFTRSERDVIDGFSTSLKSGDVAVLQGANGSGKTTLLKLLAGLLQADRGAVELNGQAIAESDINELRLYIGHKLALDEAMTVGQNIELWAKLSDHPELIAPAIDYFGLGAYLDLPVQSLSAGWKKRVALTRLIVIPRKIWLLDEPTTNLDDDAVALFESLCSARREQGGLIVMSLHGAVSDEYVKIINLS